MPGISIAVSDTGLQKRIAALQSGLSDLKPVLRVWGEIGVSSIARNFEEGGRPKRWKPLSPVTLALRRRRRKGTRSGRVAVSTKVLFVTGTLSRVRYTVLANSVQLGTAPAARAYAAIHQYGGRAGRNRKVHIPARPYMLLQQEDIAEITRVGKAYFVNQGRP